MQDPEYTLGLRFEKDKDIRHTEPNINGLRLRNFKTGWDDATIRKHIYTKETFQQLTWQNLGNRLGAILGPTSESLQEEMYDVCVKIQEVQQKGPDSKGP